MGENRQLRVLYTEDSDIIQRDLALAMSVLLDAEVEAYLENDQARARIDSGATFDIYIFDDNTPDSGSGSGTRLAVSTAQKLKDEGRRGIVVAVCASNLAILGLGDNLYLTRWENPLSLDDLHSHGVEFWFKFTERGKMVAWLADCVREEQTIPRVEWLSRVGEETRYEIEEHGRTTIDFQFRYLFDQLSWQKDLAATFRGAFMKIDTKELFRRLRAGNELSDVLRELMPENSVRRERER